MVRTMECPLCGKTMIVKVLIGDSPAFECSTCPLAYMAAFGFSSSDPVVREKLRRLGLSVLAPIGADHASDRSTEDEVRAQVLQKRVQVLRESAQKIEQPTPAIVTAKDATQLVLIPEGEFLAGDKYEEGGPFPVWLPPYYLGLYPVTNAQYARFTEETGTHKEWKPRAGAGPDHPAVGVSWYEAQTYCRWAGLRLPSELEWEKGARGVGGREYPWGDEFDETKCRNRKNKGSQETCGVGQYEEGRSPWGLYQMAGNVSEWCDDLYDKWAYSRYKTGDLAKPSFGDGHVLRGGDWDSASAFVYFKCADRNRGISSLGGKAVGFRCAR